MALVQEQQVELLQRLARDALAAAEPVVERGDEHEVLVEQGEFDDSGHAERDRQQQQVEAAGVEALDEAGGLLLVHLEVEVRVTLVDEPQYGRQQIRCHGRDHPEAQDAGERRTDRLGLLQQRADRVQYRLRAHGETFTGGREQHLARRTLKEGHPEGLLQCRDRAGQGGLAHPDGGCRVPEVQVLGDGGEGPQLCEARLPSLAVTRGH